jgi:hypothetical protein
VETQKHLKHHPKNKKNLCSVIKVGYASASTPHLHEMIQCMGREERRVVSSQSHLSLKAFSSSTVSFSSYKHQMSSSIAICDSHFHLVCLNDTNTRLELVFFVTSDSCVPRDVHGHDMMVTGLLKDSFQTNRDHFKHELNTWMFFEAADVGMACSHQGLKRVLFYMF